MSRFRRQLLFLCDAFLFAVAVAGYKFITVLLPYTATGAEENFWGNAALLYGCTVLAQLVFKTYDSLWRYAESREYLMLIASAFTAPTNWRWPPAERKRWSQCRSTGQWPHRR